MQLVQVVHRGDPRAAQRPSRVWRRGARGFLCTHLGKLLVMPVLACSALLLAPSASRHGACP
jgi:hypothetical protein